jgi:hypothetical protein
VGNYKTQKILTEYRKNFCLRLLVGLSLGLLDTVKNPVLVLKPGLNPTNNKYQNNSLFSVEISENAN